MIDEGRDRPTSEKREPAIDERRDRPMSALVDRAPRRLRLSIAIVDRAARRTIAPISLLPRDLIFSSTVQSQFDQI